MFKYKLGEDIFNVPAEEVDIFEMETPDAIRITDEITDPEEGKTNGVAETGATVTPTTGPAPESTESDSVDTLSVSQPKRIGRLEQRKKRLEKIKAKKAENWVNDFALEVNTPNFNDLHSYQIQLVQDEAV